MATYFRGTPCWLPRTERSFSRAAASSDAASSFENDCHRRPMRNRPAIRNAFMNSVGKKARYLKTWPPSPAGRDFRRAPVAEGGRDDRLAVERDEGEGRDRGRDCDDQAPRPWRRIRLLIPHDDMI